MDTQPFQTSLLDSPDLQVTAIGQGFDIYGSFDVKSFIRSLFDFSKAPTQTIDFLGNTFTIPQCVYLTEDTETSYSEKAAYGRDQLQRDFAASVGVDVDAGAFSGQMKIAYSTSQLASSEYSYSYKHLVMQLGFIQLNNADGYLSDNFINDLNKLPDTFTDDDLDAFSSFFDRYGSYYTSKVIIGGRFEFYVATENQSGLDTSTISATMHAQYEGLFTKGSFDAGLTASSEWQSYAKNSSFNLMAQGGDPTLGSALIQTDPTDPSSNSVAAFTSWLNSMKEHPAIVDFELSPISDLCGERKATVDRAWTLYRDRLHPRLTVTTQSSFVAWPLPAANPPVVSLSTLKQNQIKPSTDPGSASGWLVILIDCSRDLSDPSCIQAAEYHCLPDQQNWMGNYLGMYDEMASSIASKATKSTLLIMTSFGIDHNMLPSDAMRTTMATFGASTGLTQWVETTNSPGSEIDNSSYFVAQPFAYCLIGLARSDPGGGVESQLAFNEGTLSLTAYLFRMRYDGGYTLGT